jgi:hypothetical protein
MSEDRTHPRMSVTPTGRRATLVFVGGGIGAGASPRRATVLAEAAVRADLVVLDLSYAEVADPRVLAGLTRRLAAASRRLRLIASSENAGGCGGGYRRRARIRGVAPEAVAAATAKRRKHEHEAGAKTEGGSVHGRARR